MQACAGPHMWEWVLLYCVSLAPNHLSRRCRRVRAPVISVQQLLGSSLCFPTMVPRAKTHSQDDNVCLVLLSADAHVNSAVAKRPALKGAAALPLAGATRAFIVIPCGRVFRAALIRFCHHLNGETGELMWIKYQRPISCSVLQTRPFLMPSP